MSANELMRDVTTSWMGGFACRPLWFGQRDATSQTGWRWRWRRRGAACDRAQAPFLDLQIHQACDGADDPEAAAVQWVALISKARTWPLLAHQIPAPR